MPPGDSPRTGPTRWCCVRSRKASMASSTLEHPFQRTAGQPCPASCAISGLQVDQFLSGEVRVYAPARASRTVAILLKLSAMTPRPSQRCRSSARRAGDFGPRRRQDHPSHATGRLFVGRRHEMALVDGCIGRCGFRNRSLSVFTGE